MGACGCKGQAGCQCPDEPQATGTQVFGTYLPRNGFGLRPMHRETTRGWNGFRNAFQTLQPDQVVIGKAPEPGTSGPLEAGHIHQVLPGEQPGSIVSGMADPLDGGGAVPSGGFHCGYHIGAGRPI